MLFGLQTTELLIILGIVVILFGVGKFGKLGDDLGDGIKRFKDSLQGKNKNDESDETKSDEK